MNRRILNLNWKGHILYQSESCTASNSQCKPHEKKVLLFHFSYFILLFLFFIVYLINLGQIFLCNYMYAVFSVAHSCLTLCNSSLEPARFFSSWDSPGKNSEVGYYFLFQGIVSDPGIEATSPALAGRFFGGTWVDKMFLIFPFYYIFMFIFDLYLISDKHVIF